MTRKSKKTIIPEEELVVAPIEQQLITDTIEKNYMPYVMSVIISRAIPEIDGLKPSHRKLLYTMYKMGLLTGNRTKSANIVGATMKLNPHGDAAIYETMVRLTRGNGALLHPFVDSKGSFGKHYSTTNMKYAASRYTEAKLDSFCAELFKGIDKNAVDLVDNYDGSMKEPTLLPTTFPNILVTPNTGIAVGMASNICSFNLAEVCDGTIAVLKKPNLSVDELLDIIKAPDFSGGGTIIYDRAQMREIYLTGQGPVKIRSRYVYNKEYNSIDILQIPYSTSIELIINRITELVKEGKLKEVVNFHDAIDLNGFKLCLELKKGVDPEKLMAKLFKQTPLEDSFKCNFNVLINSTPRQLGVLDLIKEWIAFRMECLTRELTFELEKKKDKLHLLKGLAKILLDIDKAIRIIRHTKKEADVIPNLMKGFGIDEIQAEYIAEIKLRNLNEQYIINRLEELEGIKAEIEELEGILGDKLKLKSLIATQLKEIKKKYGQPRRSLIMDANEVVAYNEEDHVENYNVKLYLTKEGYFKKITLQSLRGSDEQKLKEGDEIISVIETDNLANLIFFTDKCQLYRVKCDEFDCVKASSLGEFLPNTLEMDQDEKPIFMKVQNTYSEEERFVFVFQNGKCVCVPTSSYETKSNRKKLVNAYSSASPICAIFSDTKKKHIDIMMINSANKAIIVSSESFTDKSTRTAGGTSIMTLKKGQTVVKCIGNPDDKVFKGYRKIKVPAAGVTLSKKDLELDQLKIDG